MRLDDLAKDLMQGNTKAKGKIDEGFNVEFSFKMNSHANDALVIAEQYAIKGFKVPSYQKLVLSFADEASYTKLIKALNECKIVYTTNVL